MTSLRQIQANRRNALKSSGPKTHDGKQRSRRNAVRHGLTAETVIGALEDAKDYQAFEAAIIADYDAQSAVERELVLRLSSLLWRLRRATTIETGLFDIQAEQLAEFRESRLAEVDSRRSLYALFGRTDWIGAGENRAPDGVTNPIQDASIPGRDLIDPGGDLANCYLRLANLPSFALDRLSRYEAILWRQVAQILIALDALRRRKPHETGRYFQFRSRHERYVDGRDER